MVVRMRLARYGHRNLPFYRIVVANARAPRNGKFIEKIGTYDPIPDNFGNKHIRLNTERVKYWLSVGVQPTDTMARLLSKFNLYPAPPYRSTLPYDMTIFARPLPVDDKQYPDPRTSAAARNPRYLDRIPSDEPVQPNPPTRGQIEKQAYIRELRQGNILKRYIPTHDERESQIQSELAAKIARIEAVRIGITDETEIDNYVTTKKWPDNADEKELEMAKIDAKNKGMTDEKEIEEYAKQQVFQRGMAEKEEDEDDNDEPKATDNKTSEPASSASPSTSSASAEPASSASTSTSSASSTTPKREYHTATSTSTRTSHLYRHPSHTLLHRCTSPYTSTHMLLSRWHV